MTPQENGLIHSVYLFTFFSYHRNLTNKIPDPASEHDNSIMVLVLGHRNHVVEIRS